VTSKVYDIAIIGGGINGCGIARDAAGRGLSVFLAEKSDLASATSSASTKLIHGGLRYLEHYEFRLVRESLRERETLWAMAPHLIAPLRFVLPHQKSQRPAWFIRLGLFLYDHLGGRKLLPSSHGLDLSKDVAGEPLKPAFKQAFEYSDCRVDDARLVVLNAMDAAGNGAHVHTRTEITAATRGSDHWAVETLNHTTDKTETIKAKILINAAGPWVSQVISTTGSGNPAQAVKLVKGSHIVVPALFSHDKAYIFQNPDARIIFAIPYEGDFTLIGTTDVDYGGDPATASISDAEVIYLCDAASEYFTRKISPSDVVWSYSGVRPLYDDGAASAQKITRDYVLDIDHQAGRPVTLNIFGGKITTYRHLAEDVMKKLEPWLPSKASTWTEQSPLPGGNFPTGGLHDLVDQLTDAYPALDNNLIARLVRAYGTLAFEALGDRQTADDLGQLFGANLYEFEVRYLMTKEWAASAEDILWRRSKLGLRFSEQESRDLDEWMNNNKISSIRAVA
jgi:glycerol-3-phosphate dehydrogenase